jgi:hypothetical protein
MISSENRFPLFRIMPWESQSIHAQAPRSKALQARLNREKGALGI